MVNDLQSERFPGLKVFSYITFQCEKCKVAFTSGFVLLSSCEWEEMSAQMYQRNNSASVKRAGTGLDYGRNAVIA